MMRTIPRILPVLLLTAITGIAACGGAGRPAEWSELEAVWNDGVQSGTFQIDKAPRWEIDTDYVCLPDSLVEALAVDATAGAVIVSESVLVVPNPRTYEVLFFDLRTGEAVVHGREGEGPGEFRNLWRVNRLSGDTVVVFDRRLRRVIAVTRTEGAVWTAPVPAPPPGDSAVVVDIVGPFASASIGVVGWARRTAPIGRSRAIMYVYRWDRDVGTVTRVASGFGQEVQIEFIDSGPDPAILPPLFPRESAVVVSGGRIIVAHDEAYALRSIDSLGLDTVLVRLTVEPEPMSKDRIDAERDRLLKQYPAFPPRITAKLESQAPDVVPTVRDLVADSEEHVWILPELEPPRWLVFSTGGRLVATVDHPGWTDEIVDVASGLVVGIRKNASGVSVPCASKVVLDR